MAHSYPVYTIEAECQDCYKCVRHCPVKAIQVKDGHAAVVADASRFAPSRLNRLEMIPAD